MLHTKGEWVLKSDLQMYYFIDSKETGQNIASVMKEYTKTPIEEAEANAKLISAAPDLLEALRDIVNNTLVQLIAFPKGWDNNGLEEQLSKANAAIDKATL